ncbi:DUF5685 family protein, partial [Magnetococcales bacterium HHB-1]
MYGHIQAIGCKEKQQWQAQQCALCDSLGSHYGFLSRLLTNCDTPILQILIDGQASEAPPIRQIRCPINLKRKKVRVSQEASDFTASATLLLFIERLEDAIYDSKGLKRTLIKIIRHWIKKQATTAHHKAKRFG